MANCPPKPPPGSTGASTDTTGTVIVGLFGAIGTIGSIVGIVIEATKTSTIPVIGVTGAGVGAIGLSAAVAAAAVILTSFAFWWDRCLSNPDGEQSCSAGVIDDIVPSFNDATSVIFPFTVQHDLVSMVMQCQFWP